MGKRELPINLNSSNRKIMDVANSLQERLMKFGRLDVGKNLVAKKASSNINAYIQDDFIEDPEEVMATEDMEMFETQYDDFFVVVGDMKKFETSKSYQDRIDLISSRNRANKNRELQRIKKNNRKRQENNEIKMLQNTNIQKLKEKINRKKNGEEEDDLEEDDFVDDKVERKIKP